MSNIDFNNIVNYNNKPEVIMDEMRMYFQQILPRIEQAALVKNSRSPLRYDPHYAISSKFKQTLRKWKTMPDEQAMELSAEALYELYMEFLDVITEINITYSYAPTKVEFCAYCCISIEAYNRLLTEGDIKVRQQMSDIDSDLIDSIERSTEVGVSNKFTEVRLTSKGTGHSLKRITPLDDALDTMNETLKDMELERRLAAIVKPDQKKIGNEENNS